MRLISLLFMSKRNVLIVSAIILLLIIQAWCDLALPRYTSAIVDKGIMLGGIENAVPDRIRVASLDQLRLFMSAEEEATVEKAYDRAKNGSRKLIIKRKDSLRIQQLDRVFQTPMFLLSAAGNPELNANTEGLDNLPPPAQLRAAVESGQIRRQTLLAMRENVENSAAKLDDATQVSAAAEYVQAEYKALGMDLQRIQMDFMIQKGVAMALYTLASILSAIAICFLAGYSAARVAKDLREDMFARILSFSPQEMNRFTGASLITRSTNDLMQVQMTLVIFMRIVLLAPIYGIGGAIMVLNTETGLDWLIVIAVAFLLILVPVMLKITLEKFKILQILVDKLNLVSREILTGLPVIRAFCRENFEKKRFAEANEDLTQIQIFTGRVMGLMFPVLTFAMNILTVIIVWFGAHAIDLGDLQVGSLMAFITYVMMIVSAFVMLSVIAIMLPRANVAAQRIHDVISTEPSIRDKPESEQIRREKWQGVVSFQNVSFRFPGAEADALKNISFTATPGQTTAIIGSTGSGKSTLVGLIPRFYDVTEGRVTIDDIDIRHMAQQDLRGLLGYVPQKGILFSGDIRSNICFGNPEMPEDEMENAARIAQAYDFITEKEQGFDSAVAQGGTNVSGGQKQRISIARAISKQPKIFIFDDSFSALDYGTDAALRRALKQNLSGAAIIVVAQRIATIMQAEQIIVMDHGEIVGTGTHKQLLERCQVYREIASGQLSEEELSA